MAAREVLEFVIRGDARGAVDAFRRVETAAGQTGQAVTKTSGGFAGMFDKMTARFPAAGRAAERFGLSASNAGAVAATAATAGATAIGAFALKSVQAYQEVAAQILQFQRVSGTSAEAASRWVEVAGDYGVSSDEMGAAIGRLAKQASTAPDKLAALGVQVARNVDGTTNLEATMLRAAEAFRSQTDDAKKAELGMALFGKSWQSLVPLLVQGADGLTKSLEGVADAKILDDKDLRQAEEFRLALDDLKDVSEGLMIQVGKGLVPVLEDLATELKDVSDLVGALPGDIGLGDLARSADRAIDPIAKVRGAIESARRAMRGEFVSTGWKDALNQFTGGEAAARKYSLTLGDLNTGADRAAQAAGENARLNAVLSKSLEELAADEEALKKNLEDREKVADSLRKVEDERRKVQDDLAQSIRDVTSAGLAAQAPELAYKAAVRDTAGAIREAHVKAQEYQDEISDPAKAEAAEAAQHKVAESILVEAEAWVKNRGKVLETEDGAQDYINKLDELKRKIAADFPEAAALIQKQIEYWAGVKVEIGLAVAQAAAYARLASAPGRITATADAAARALDSGDAGASAPAPSAGYEGGGDMRGPRATGGPVMAQGAYLVGERGPEIFVPGRNGQIVPNDAIGAGNGGGGESVMRLVVELRNGFVSDSVALGRSLADALVAYASTSSNAQLKAVFRR